ncbi:hypothetical protein K0A97_01160 [Patescibacteria group bacterium]|nr:hypothetical protein [Patescibacteria group bacterium]
MKKKKTLKKSIKKQKEEDNSGLFIPAGLFVGMGLGFALENLVAWLFMGLGAGFLAMAVYKARDIKKKGSSKK